MSLERVIKWLRVVLGFLVVGIVIENAHIFALIQGVLVNLALIVCFIIIGIKLQLRVNDEN